MSVTMTASRQDFVIHEDPPSSSTESDFAEQLEGDEGEYEADDSILTSDEAVQSIEKDLQALQRKVSDSRALPPSSPPLGSSTMTRANSRRVSGLTTTSRQSCVSSLPSSVPFDDEDMSPYTPMKNRPHFSNMSAIRAIQMATPPRFESLSPSRSSSYMPDKTYRTPKSERRHDAPRSRRDESRSTMRSSRSGTPLRDQTQSRETASSNRSEMMPLVLLHVTVIPQSWPYSSASMEAVLPKAIIDNQHLLQEKLIPTVLARGLLLSHPHAEYELLEERILEALELKIPRVLNCGHYFQESDDSADESETKTVVTSTSGCAGTAAGEGEVDPFSSTHDHCLTCHRDMALPGRGVGHGSRRWDVKIYAANGLMRAGAWAAAWKEMERVDVEIGPLVPDQLRRQLDQLLLEEEQEALKAAEAAEEARRITAREAPLLVRNTVNATEPHGRTEAEHSNIHSTTAEHQPRERHMRRSNKDVSLQTLLQNYVLLLSRDRKNVALALLSVFVVLLAMRPSAPGAAVMQNPLPVARPEVLRDIHASAKETVSKCQASTLLQTTTVTVSVSLPEMTIKTDALANESTDNELAATTLTEQAGPEDLDSNKAVESEL